MPTESELDRYAELALSVGLNLQAGQPLMLSGSVHSLPLLRAIARAAYRRGARAVVTDLSDPLLTRMAVTDTPEAYLDDPPDWKVRARLRAVEEGAALLTLVDEDPYLLAGVDQERLQKMTRAAMRVRSPYLERVGAHEVNWLAVGGVTPGWAQAVFPDLGPEDAQERLWRAVFKTVRLDEPDPQAAWREHLARLEERADLLNKERFTALVFRGPGTDLRVGLARRHVWKSAVARAQNGVPFVPNLPTEEVFTAPDPEQVDGVVSSTRPLNIGGTLVEGITARFENGRAVEVRAESGGEALTGMLAADPGALRLGEVALVETPNPVYDAGFLFLNTLYDENAASHIAFGRAYADTLGITSGSDEALAKAGGNVSMVHLDWMIGSPAVSVWGLRAGGAETPLMAEGRWL